MKVVFSKLTDNGFEHTEYIVNGHTQTETAKLLNSTVDCVAAALRKFNIKRTPEQAHDVMSRGAKKVKLTPEQKKQKELHLLRDSTCSECRQVLS